MKNGKQKRNLIEIISILSRCERALGINKVTGLQRWCPKLEVKKIQFIRNLNYKNFIEQEWDEWRTATSGDKRRKG